jgi:hypothetical protein
LKTFMRIFSPGIRVPLVPAGGILMVAGLSAMKTPNQPEFAHIPNAG